VQARDGLPSREAVQGRPAGPPAPNGRHAAARDDEPGSGWSGSSWHNALWSRDRTQDRLRRSEPDRARADAEEDDRASTGPEQTIPIAADTSQVVSRLAQLLRDNPSLATSWGREAQE
jgi:hypothetical protein